MTTVVRQTKYKADYKFVMLVVKMVYDKMSARSQRHYGLNTV